MREVNPPEPDDPFNPEKREAGRETRHPESVQQGPSTATGGPDLRSEQGELQCKAKQSLRHSTAAVPGRPWMQRQRPLRWTGQQTGHFWGLGPPLPAGGKKCVQFSYCSGIPGVQISGIRSPGTICWPMDTPGFVIPKKSGKWS